MEWLAALAAFLAFYSYLYLHVTTGETNLSEGLQLHIILLPIHLIILFGVSVSSFVIEHPQLEQNQHSIAFYRLHNQSTVTYNTSLNQIHYSCFLFQLYSVSTVLYRVFTFNDCPEAAKEIQQQIEEAKADLSAKGLKF